MKIATFNIQNLFHRDKSLIKNPLSHCASNLAKELDSLMLKHQKENRDFDRIRELSFLLGFDKVEHSRYAVLRRRNGRLYFQERGYSHETRASHLTNFNGWVALQTMPLHKTAIENKARVIAETNADILMLQEVEDRASLMEFNQKMVLDFDVDPYEHIMVVEGNDIKGLSMGILTKKDYSLENIKNHIHDRDDEGKPLFDIDCPEYTIVTPSGEEITIVDAHLSELEETRRKKQSAKIANIYHRLASEGKQNIVISGVLNDVYFSNALAPLLQETDLKDISKHETFHTDVDQGKDASYFRLGAYRLGVNLRQKEYVLLSPSLYAKLWKGGLHRTGVWQDKKPNWQIYSTIKQKRHAASEHPLVWGEIGI